MASVIIPPVPPSLRDDAAHLYEAFKGFGCDTAAVVNILAHRNIATQRDAIQKKYNTMHSEDLNKRLSSELSVHVKKAILLWMPDPATRDANIVRHALDRGVDLKAASEVICSRTPSQLRQFKQIYFSNFSLLLAFVSESQYEGPEFDQLEVEKDSEAQYKAGGKRFAGADDKTFIDIFNGRSRAHLAAVSSTYQNKYRHTLEKETSGNFGHALMTILQCAQHRAIFFLQRFYVRRLRVWVHPTLTRVVVTRAESDMQYIKAEYHQRNMEKH
ncbi:putative annexin [Rosa chinensis]|uniref:Putative annexin n=1 Tax=Rosa chinensis TaxID=74649 RepID=A0A2P6R1A2_ROSCH|nr:putative annexin [Rosa chinensis]